MWPKALAAYEDALKAVESSHTYVDKPALLIRIGNVYSSLGDWTAAAGYFRKA